MDGRNNKNQIRQQLQEEALDTLIKNHYVKVNWGTGIGKSRVAVGAVKTLFAYGRKKILLLVAETLHKENWRREFVDALGEELGGTLYRHTIIECYASLGKYERTSWDLIIADEAHHLRSDLRCNALATMRADFFLSLSATLSCGGDGDALEAVMEKTFGHFVSLDFSVQNAIDKGILAEPKIYVHVIPIADLRKTVEIVEEWGAAAKRKEVKVTYAEHAKYFDRMAYPALRLVIECLPKQAYDYYTKAMEKMRDKIRAACRKEGVTDPYEGPPYLKFMQNKFLQYSSERKKLLGKVKTTFAKGLLSSLGDKKYICFCSDVEQGTELGGDRVIYSGRTDGIKNADVITGFNSGDISSLFAVNMIQEGQNLAGIQAGVVIQLGGKERQFIQKFGRALRSSAPEQHIIILNGTRDVDYYRTAIAGINRKYVTYKTYGSLRKEDNCRVRTGTVPTTGVKTASRSGLRQNP